MLNNIMSAPIRASGDWDSQQQESGIGSLPV